MKIFDLSKIVRSILNVFHGKNAIDIVICYKNIVYFTCILRVNWFFYMIKKVDIFHI